MHRTYLFEILGLLIMIMGFSCSNEQAHKTTEHIQYLHDNWLFKNPRENQWLSATIPGCVHTDLLDNGKIEDPFYRLNEKKVQWIGETDWIYKTSFNVNNDLFNQPKIELVFDGLDTYADIYVNDSLILSTDNMFRQWTVDVKKILKRKNNKLMVYFHNVFKVNMPKWENAPFRLFAYPNNDQADIKINMYSRKAAYEFGWDWGPRLITSGIWRPVYLRAWGKFRIKDIYYRQDSVSKSIAKISTHLTIESKVTKKVNIKVKHEDDILASSNLTLSKGINEITLPIEIDSPILWWTNGLGDQYLYNFKCIVTDDDGYSSKNETEIGIRSLRIVTDKDKFGKSFFVELNGVPVFMKGANYIPQDNFLNRVTKEKYKYIINSAVKANMNMLRVWGGGIYENDIFYDLCDKNGILVWQDMMFACSMYPSDTHFINNVEKEITYNIKRLRNHACIALYCGNNELEIAWNAWGMKNEYPDSIQKVYENNYQNLFHKVIPNAIHKVDNNRHYIPSSPMAGMPGRPLTTGDSHYWDVWHGKKPFKEFENNVARFMSEYGFQSYPNFSSIKKFTEPQDWVLSSEVMQSHQRCMADDRKDKDYGNKLIDTYLKRNFREPKDFENYVYVVQALQAKGVSTAIEAHRKEKADNYCMGTLYWQINDCWPVASWSSIDYYGKWKALHYYVKKYYEPLLISQSLNDNLLRTYIISDYLYDIEGVVVSINLFDFDGQLLWHISKDCNIKANSSRIYLENNLHKILDAYDKRTVLLYTSIKTKSGELLADKKFYFQKEKFLILKEPKFTINIKEAVTGYKIEISSNTLARYVFLSLKGKDNSAFFSDNYFDLMPNETKVVSLTTKCDFEYIKSNLKITSLHDSY